MTAEPWDELQAAITKHTDGVIVTKFLVIAETISTEDGARQIEWFKPNSLAIWDAIGFSDYVAECYRARIRANESDT